ncbi:MAG: hypothetical protein ACRCR2_02375 [Fusobacteriaceae bacterium]
MRNKTIGILMTVESQTLKNIVEAQCKWIVSNCSDINFDVKELDFLQGLDRSNSATGQMDYLGHLIERHFIVLPISLVKYPETPGTMFMQYSLKALHQFVDNYRYLESRIGAMAKYGRSRKALAEPKEETLTFTHVEHGECTVTYKQLFMEFIPDYNLKPYEVRKIIKRGYGITGGWSYLA